MTDRNRFVRRGAAVLYAAAILGASSVSGSDAKKLDIPYDKPIHAVEYALFTILLVRAGSSGKRPSWKVLAFAAVVGVGYGALDETYQRLIPGRSCDLADFIADMTGVAVGISAWLWIATRCERFR